jgi:hypothetical protein
MTSCEPRYAVSGVTEPVSIQNVTYTDSQRVADGVVDGVVQLGVNPVAPAPLGCSLMVMMSRSAPGVPISITSQSTCSDSGSQKPEI